MKPWKLQKFFGDVVYDLRNKGLLPVVILLLVAMVAVPIVIARGGSGGSDSSVQSSSALVEPAPETKTAVVSYAPGVRDYKKRLDKLSAKDPFLQKFAESAAAAADLNSAVAAPTESSSSSAPVAAAPSGSTGSSSTGSTGSSSATSTGGGGGTSVRYFYSVADVSVGDVTQPLARHKKLKAFTALPNPVAPVMIYLGSSLDGKRAYFSVSKAVTQLTGPGTCAPSPTDCSLLVLGPGKAEDMVYSVDSKTYRVKINKISRVFVKAPPAG